MPEGGKLAISVSKYMLTKDDETLMEQVNPGEYIKVVVEDTGTGIEKDIIDKIFEPFFTSKRLGRGTGLGLSVVLGIIRTHQGAIHVSSEPSKGTSFSIFFPRVEGIQSKKPPVESFTKGNAEKILIIEDETSIQHLLGKILKRYNYQPIFASSMMEAEEVYSRSFRKIELVVCDMVLPDGNGFETIDKLNLIHPIKRLVFASGYLDDISRLDEIKARQIPFLHKPFSTTTFIKTINQALKENLGPQTAGMIQ
jgi:CheY-like chemotaxis protein